MTSPSHGYSPARDSDSKIPCPICNVPFDATVIQVHAAQCGASPVAGIGEYQSTYYGSSSDGGSGIYAPYSPYSASSSAASTPVRMVSTPGEGRIPQGDVGWPVRRRLIVDDHDPSVPSLGSPMATGTSLSEQSGSQYYGSTVDDSSSVEPETICDADLLSLANTVIESCQSWPVKTDINECLLLATHVTSVVMSRPEALLNPDSSQSAMSSSEGILHTVVHALNSAFVEGCCECPPSQRQQWRGFACRALIAASKISGSCLIKIDDDMGQSISNQSGSTAETVQFAHSTTYSVAMLTKCMDLLSLILDPSLALWKDENLLHHSAGIASPGETNDGVISHGSSHFEAIVQLFQLESGFEILSRAFDNMESDTLKIACTILTGIQQYLKGQAARDWVSGIAGFIARRLLQQRDEPKFYSVASLVLAAYKLLHGHPPPNIVVALVHAATMLSKGNSTQVVACFGVCSTLIRLFHSNSIDGSGAYSIRSQGKSVGLACLVAEMGPSGDSYIPQCQERDFSEASVAELCRKLDDCNHEGQSSLFGMRQFIACWICFLGTKHSLFELVFQHNPHEQVVRASKQVVVFAVKSGKLDANFFVNCFDATKSMHSSVSAECNDLIASSIIHSETILQHFLGVAVARSVQHAWVAEENALKLSFEEINDRVITFSLWDIVELGPAVLNHLSKILMGKPFEKRWVHMLVNCFLTSFQRSKSSGSQSMYTVATSKACLSCCVLALAFGCISDEEDQTLFQLLSDAVLQSNPDHLSHYVNIIQKLVSFIQAFAMGTLPEFAQPFVPLLNSFSELFKTLKKNLLSQNQCQGFCVACIRAHETCLADDGIESIRRCHSKNLQYRMALADSLRLALTAVAGSGEMELPPPMAQSMLDIASVSSEFVIPLLSWFKAECSQDGVVSEEFTDHLCEWIAENLTTLPKECFGVFCELISRSIHDADCDNSSISSDRSCSRFQSEIPLLLCKELVDLLSHHHIYDIFKLKPDLEVWGNVIVDTLHLALGMQNHDLEQCKNAKALLTSLATYKVVPENGDKHSFPCILSLLDCLNSVWVASKVDSGSSEFRSSSLSTNQELFILHNLVDIIKQALEASPGMFVSNRRTGAIAGFSPIVNMHVVCSHDLSDRSVHMNIATSLCCRAANVETCIRKALRSTCEIWLFTEDTRLTSSVPLHFVLPPDIPGTLSCTKVKLGAELLNQEHRYDSDFDEPSTALQTSAAHLFSALRIAGQLCHQPAENANICFQTLQDLLNVAWYLPAPNLALESFANVLLDGWYTRTCQSLGIEWLEGALDAPAAEASLQPKEMEFGVAFLCCDLWLGCAAGKCSLVDLHQDSWTQAFLTSGGLHILVSILKSVSSSMQVGCLQGCSPVNASMKASSAVCLPLAISCVDLLRTLMFGVESHSFAKLSSASKPGIIQWSDILLFELCRVVKAVTSASPSFEDILAKKVHQTDLLFPLIQVYQAQDSSSLALYKYFQLMIQITVWSGMHGSSATSRDMVLQTLVDCLKNDVHEFRIVALWVVHGMVKDGIAAEANSRTQIFGIAFEALTSCNNVFNLDEGSFSQKIASFSAAKSIITLFNHVDFSEDGEDYTPKLPRLVLQFCQAIHAGIWMRQSPASIKDFLSAGKLLMQSFNSCFETVASRKRLCHDEASGLSSCDGMVSKLLPSHRQLGSAILDVPTSFVSSVIELASKITFSGIDSNASAAIHEFFKIHMDGKFFISPAFGRRAAHGIVGLENKGMTCFFNAVIQLMCACSNLVEGLLQLDSSNASCANATFLEHFQKLVVDILFGNGFPDHTHVFQNLNVWGSRLEIGVQHDAEEALSALLDSVVESEQSQTDGEIKEAMLSKSLSGRSVFRSKHSVCGHESESTDSFNILKICLAKEGGDIVSLLKHKSETISDYKCQKCGAIGDICRTESTELPSNLLFVQIKRFEFDMRTGMRIKRDDEVTFPQKLRTSPDGILKSVDGVEAEYALKGIILHSGSAEGGHYVSAVCTSPRPCSLPCEHPSFASNASWFLIDDSKVERTDESVILNAAYGGKPMHFNAYILAYERVDQKGLMSEIQGNPSSTFEPAADLDAVMKQLSDSSIENGEDHKNIFFSQGNRLGKKSAGAALLVAEALKATQLGRASEFITAPATLGLIEEMICARVHFSNSVEETKSLLNTWIKQFGKLLQRCISYSSRQSNSSTNTSTGHSLSTFVSSLFNCMADSDQMLLEFFTASFGQCILSHIHHQHAQGMLSSNTFGSSVAWTMQPLSECLDAIPQRWLCQIFDILINSICDAGASSPVWSLLNTIGRRYSLAFQCLLELQSALATIFSQSLRIILDCSSCEPSSPYSQEAGNIDFKCAETVSSISVLVLSMPAKTLLHCLVDLDSIYHSDQGGELRPESSPDNITSATVTLLKNLFDLSRRNFPMPDAQKTILRICGTGLVSVKDAIQLFETSIRRTETGPRHTHMLMCIVFECHQNSTSPNVAHEAYEKSMAHANSELKVSDNELASWCMRQLQMVCESGKFQWQLYWLLLVINEFSSLACVSLLFQQNQDWKFIMNQLKSLPRQLPSSPYVDRQQVNSSSSLNASMNPSDDEDESNYATAYSSIPSTARYLPDSPTSEADPSRIPSQLDASQLFYCLQQKFSDSIIQNNTAVGQANDLLQSNERSLSLGSLLDDMEARSTISDSGGSHDN